MTDPQGEKCDVCGAELHWSPLVEGLPKMSTVSDCRHVVQLPDPDPQGVPRKQLEDVLEMVQSGTVNLGGKFAVQIVTELLAAQKTIERLQSHLDNRDGEESCPECAEKDATIERLTRPVSDEEADAIWFRQGMLHKPEIKRLLEAFLATRAHNQQTGDAE